ncbi:MAG: MFS transporter [Desulfotalea sp.]
MSNSTVKNLTWQETMKAWTRPKVLVMLVLGFSAGLPILLIFSTLSVWLREAGVTRSAVTFFSWAALGYSFKFVWAPVIDILPLPYLTSKLGKRRSWLLVSQIAVMASIVFMGLLDPASEASALTLMAVAAVLLGFSSATQDIVIDAYRIECDKDDMQALLASVYIAGYRIGMLVAGAGSLFLASYLGTTAEVYNFTSWQYTYFAMAAFMLIGIGATFFCDEPVAAPVKEYKISGYIRFCLLFAICAATFIFCFFYTGDIVGEAKKQLTPLLTKPFASLLLESIRLMLSLFSVAVMAKIVVSLGLVEKSMVEETYFKPVQEFFSRYGLKTALLVLALIGCYRISDIVLGVISNVFYMDMGFSKNVIAGVTKTFGLCMTLVGGFLGGMVTIRYGVHRILVLGAVLAPATNLLFMLLVNQSGNVNMLAVVIGADNFCAGLASTAFVAFLSSLTNVSFTAVQYAIFSSLMTLLPKFLGGYSGSLVTNIGYENFFLTTALIGVPIIFLAMMVSKLLQK